MQDPGNTTIVMSSETQVQLEGLNAGYDYNFQVFILPALLTIVKCMCVCTLYFYLHTNGVLLRRSITNILT